MRRALMWAAITWLLGGCAAAPAAVDPALAYCDSHFVGRQGKAAGPLRARFFGVSTILLEDDKTAIMTDGFFSRPDLASTLFGTVSPNEKRIKEALEGVELTKLAAVMTLHSHYDHALDTATVAKHAHAHVVGSMSTANLARAGGVADADICLVRGGTRFDLDGFRVTALEATHSPQLWLTKGGIAPLPSPPTRAAAFREGGTFAYLVEHGGRRILIHGSAGFLPDMFRDVDVTADILFLGIATLGKRSETDMHRFWDETVVRSGAKRVFLVHWDNFFLPLERGKPLEPLGLLDDIDGAMAFLKRKAELSRVDLIMPQAFEFLPLD
jgi:L-ascorbate metabolism protein UlaG (beta-lactamase superfamily)